MNMSDCVLYKYVENHSNMQGNLVNKSHEGMVLIL